MNERRDSWEGPDTLGLDAEEMRRLGHWLVDAVVDHREGLRRQPAMRTGDPAELLEALGGPVPEEPGDALSEMKLLVDSALANMQHGDHPRYFARIPGPSSFAGVLGEWLGVGFNALVASWAGGSGPATVELVVLDWLRQLLGLPEGCEGVLLSGGSLANLTGLAAARAACGAGVVYLSDQTHASVGRALRTLGFHADHIRVLESSGDFCLPSAEVSRALAADRRAGLHPRVLVATAGTTNTGAVDPLRELAELSRTENLWLHVDGAYGAPAALCDAGRTALSGLELADSLVLDPHKWLFSPYDVGCLLVRRPGALAQAFAMHPEYLADVTALGGEVDFRDRSPELSRRSRALKLWLVLRTYGLRRIRAAIARGIALAEFAQGLIEADPRWELVTPAQLGIVTFALSGAGGEEQATRADGLTRDGYAAVSTTVLRGRSVLRLCTINPLTTEDELVSTLERLAT